MNAKLNRRKIEELAGDLLRKLEIARPPVDVEKVARQLGYRIAFRHLPGEVSGSLIRETDRSILIGINSYHAPVRQRFSIAHEIGHAQLHVSDEPSAESVVFVDPPGPQVLFRDGTASLGENTREIQANQYAAALLMPRDFIIDTATKILRPRFSMSEDEVVGDLAEHFQVSKQAMRYRLVALGVLEPN